MNWLDITLICLAGIGFMKGLFDGVIKQVVSLIALGVAIYFCSKGALLLRGYIVALGWFSPEWITLVSYVVAFLLIVGLVTLAGEVVHRIVGITPLGIVNHIAGGIFGIALVVLFMSLIFNALEMTDRGSTLIPVQAKIESRFYFPVQQLLPTIYPHSMFLTEE